jgi:excisionase family DNA binding protein
MDTRLPGPLFPRKEGANLGRLAPKKYVRKLRGPRSGAAFLTKQEAAFELGISGRTLEQLINAGRLAKIVLSARCVRIARAELERFARDNSTAVTA